MKTCPELVTELHSMLGTEKHRVVAIEYHNRRPFSVLTEEQCERRGEAYTCCCWWDFEWCKSDKTLYYHNSGAGGDTELHVHKFASPKPPPGELWIADGLPVLRYTRNGTRTRSVRKGELLKMGYRVLSKPRLLTFGGRKTRNPFEAGEEGETIYCEVCNDRLLDTGNPPCGHLDWCDQCAAWFYPKAGKYHDSYGNGPHKCEEVFDDDR